jgi:hypothetical protein
MRKTLDLRAFWALFCIKVALVTDPACGSGNFLTVSYLSIRRLENKVIRALLDSRTARTKKEQMKITSFWWERKSI